MAEPTTAKMVWDGFIAINRYDRQINRTRAPLPSVYMPKKHWGQAEACARLIDAGLEMSPLLLPKAYTAYLFLFTQWVRISFKTAPRFVPGEGFYGLRPKPYFPMVAATTEKANRAWRGWLSHAAFLPTSQINSVYPMPLGPATELMQLTRHIGLMAEYAKKRKIPQEEVIRKLDISGNIASAPFSLMLQWHPWLQLAYSVGTKDTLFRTAAQVFAQEETARAFISILNPDIPRKQLFKRIAVLLQENQQTTDALKILTRLGRTLQ